MNQTKSYMKLIKTCNLYLAFFTLGLLLSIVGPSLLDLEHMINTDTQHISLIYTARSSGYVVGAVLGGIILDIIPYRQAVLSVCCFAAGGTMLGIPWSRNFASLFTYMVANGMFLGAVETGGNVICLNLWGKDSGPIFQGLHFTFGLGGLVSPLIAAPYLRYQPSDNPTNGQNSIFSLINSTTNVPPHWNYSRVNSTTFTNPNNPFINLTATAADNSGVHEEDRISGLTYPFSITGLFSCLVAASLLAVAIKSPTEEAHKDDSKKDNNERSLGFMLTVVVFSFSLIFVSCGMEIGYAQMLTTYSVEGSLHLTISKGSYMTSAFWASLTASRLASAFLAIRVTNLVFILSDLAFVSTAAVLLLTLMPNELVLWISSITFGIGIGSFYASAVGWINTHIYMTNKIASIITVGAAAGEMVAPFLISYFMDTVPEMFSYVIASACLLTCIVVFVMYMYFQKFDREVPVKEREIYTIRTSSINIC